MVGDTTFPSLSDVDAVLDLLPILEQPGFQAGEWAGGEKLDDGSIQMPWFKESSELGRLRGALSRHGFVVPFDWPSWRDEAARYERDRGALAMAPIGDLCIYGYPIEDACALALDTIRTFCATHPWLDEILLVAFDPEVAAAWRTLGVEERS
jgi:hypothetical protein